MNGPIAAVLISFLLMCVKCLLLSLTPFLRCDTHTHTHTHRHTQTHTHTHTHRHTHTDTDTDTQTQTQTRTHTHTLIGRGVILACGVLLPWLLHSQWGEHW